MDHQMQRDIESQDEPEAILVQIPETGLIGINIICRLCANPNERIIGIYSEEGISNDLANKMNTYLPVKVSENDTLPLQCCWSCASTVLAWHELVVASVEADRRLRNLQAVSEKHDTGEDDYSGIDDPGSPLAQDDDRSEPKSPVASLSVFCQESSPAQPKQMRYSKRKKPPPLYSMQQPLSDVKREEWIQCNVITDESLQKYIENIQDPFADARLAENPSPKKINKVEGKTARPKKPKIKHDLEEETVGDDGKTIIATGDLQINILEIKKDDLYEDKIGKEEPADGYNFSCQYCPLMFVNEDDIVNHVKQEHPDKEPDLAEGMSKVLSKKDRRKNTKLDHEAVNAAKVVVEGRIYYNCKICGKSLHSPYTYIWHMRIHTGERPYVCDLCGKQFRVSQGLVRHLRETHEGIKNFGCDICGRMFATRRNVEEHRRIHTNERPYICDLCGKSFKQKASLFVHNRSHTDSFPFRCSYCNQGFRTRPPLLIHVTRHTGEKPYPCDICGRCFRIKYELKRHKLIHSEEKPFSCSECGLSFRQKRYLRNHNKINHNRTTP